MKKSENDHRKKRALSDFLTVTVYVSVERPIHLLVHSNLFPVIKHEPHDFNTHSLDTSYFLQHAVIYATFSYQETT